jgi:hypothetical protein
MTTGSTGADPRRGTVYPSPFFDIAQTYMPPTVKELFRWCAYFFYKDPMIGSIVTKIAEYPVTDFVYNASEKHVRDGWKTLLEDTLNLKPFLIEVGLDYFTYGNAFISMNFPFIRWIQCSDCKKMFRLSDDDFSFKFRNFKFQFDCDGCKKNVTGKIVDKAVKDRTGINFVRWDPKNIDINYNPITGKSKYRYKVPNKIRKALMRGDREILVDIPEVFLRAMEKRRDIQLSDQNLFHFKRPTLAEQDMGWGKPLIIHSMTRMFYLYVLRRAQEAIALQRIMPMEFIFPQANAQQDPYQHVNLNSWQGTVKEEVRKWKQDPNYISVVSVPLGFERLGGDGRALLLGPEIEVTNKEITGGMGVPLEFVFGGLSWSGSSVSLRTLENHFLMYRRLLLRFVSWAKNRLKIYLGLPDIDLGFTEFKMADDIQRKQIVIQLNAANKISDHTMLTELGFDYDDEQEMIEKETDQRNQIQSMVMKAQTEAQGEAQVIQAKYQVRAQEAMNEAQGMASGGQAGMDGQAQGEGQMGGTPPAGQPQEGQPQGQPQEGQPQQQGQPQGQAQQQGQPQGQAQQQGQAQAQEQQSGQPQGQAEGGLPPSVQEVDPSQDQVMAGQAASQQASETMSNVEGEAGTSAGGQAPVLDAASKAKEWANAISKHPPQRQQELISELRKQLPAMSRLVEQILSQMRMGETADDVSERMKPLPQQAPPRRDGGMV